jgi:hypothetical protein
MAERLIVPSWLHESSGGATFDDPSICYQHPDPLTGKPKVSNLPVSRWPTIQELANSVNPLLHSRADPTLGIIHSAAMIFLDRCALPSGITPEAYTHSLFNWIGYPIAT